MGQVKTVAALLRLIDKEYHKDDALGEKGPNGWKSLSHKELISEVKALALYLHHTGIKRGDPVGIMAISGVRWVIADLAIMVCGAVTVPLFSNISNENFLFQCEQTHLKTLCILGEEAWQMYRRHADRFNRLISLDPAPYEEALGAGFALESKHPHLFDELLDKIIETDLATIIYTSSSTGIPKGVMLTHKNLLFISLTNFLNLNESDRFLSVLPLAHVYQRVTTLYLLKWNASIYFLNDYAKVNGTFQEIKPTVTAFVPRVLEKIYDQIQGSLQKERFLKRLIGRYAVKMALDPDFESYLFRRLADRFVYRKIRDALGGRLRGIVCGSAPLSPILIRFFYNVGIPVVEGYGMTEMMVIAANKLGHYKIGTVGAACPGVEIKISEIGEILVRSDGVMQGYYQNQIETAKVLKDGWLHTGDKGEIDSEGYLTVLGRMDETVKTSTGEWVALVPLEKALKKARFIEYAMVIAEHEKFVSALIFPNFLVVQELKAKHKQSQLSDAEFLNGKFITHEMNRLIESINTHRNHWEQIHAYRFVMTLPTIEGGELTPTFKLRRHSIMEKYRDLIEGMYPPDPAKEVEGL